MTDISFDFTSTNPNFNRFEADLARELSRLTERAVREWTRNSDAAFRRALAEATSAAVTALSEQLYDEITASLAADATGSTRGNSLSVQNLVGGRFGRALSNLVVAQVSETLSSERTSVNARETNRSQEAESSFRLSRTQQQAQQTRGALRGQRNL